jgi:hypothetical protein
MSTERIQQCKKDIAILEAELKKLEKKETWKEELENDTWMKENNIGDCFELTYHPSYGSCGYCNYYILAQTKSYRYALIGLKSGNRFYDPQDSKRLIDLMSPQDRKRYIVRKVTLRITEE